MPNSLANFIKLLDQIANSFNTVNKNTPARIEAQTVLRYMSYIEITLLKQFLLLENNYTLEDFVSRGN